MISEIIEEEIIPYIIMESCPDNFIPSINHLFGSIEKSKVHNFLFKKLVDFVFGRINLKNLDQTRCIEKFWLHFYDNYTISNSPWSTVVFIDGKWIYKYFNDNDLLNELIKKRDEMYVSSDSEDSYSSDETFESFESIIITKLDSYNVELEELEELEVDNDKLDNLELSNSELDMEKIVTNIN